MAKWMFNFIKIILLGMLAMCLILLALLTTESGRGQLVVLVNPLLQTSDFDIKLARIDGFFPLKVRVRSVLLLQGGEIWLQAFDINATADVLAYLRDNQAVVEVLAKEVSLLKLPADSDPEAPQAISLPFDIDIMGEVDHISISK